MTIEPHHGVAMVTGHEEALTVLHDTATFSSCNSVSGPFPGFPVPLDRDDVSELIELHRDELPMHDQLPVFDPPKHTDHRYLLMRLITPKRLRENEEFMWRLADRQLDQFIDKGRCEFVTEYAGPFALLVIADLLGIPEASHDWLREQFESGVTGSLGSTHGDELAHSPLGFLYDMFTEYVEDRRREPRDDVLTGLATATFPDGSLPEVIDVVRVAANLFAAGQETTVRLLAASMQALAEDPELQEKLRANREGVPNFVEEMLRFESPVKGSFRLSRVPTTVGGVDLAAGTTVMVLTGAANRDPRKFERPDEMIPDRPNARHHITFGHGIHVCPGAPLARSEGRVSLERILDRMGDIRISEERHGPPDARRYKYVPTYILRGLGRLHLEFTPAGSVSRMALNPADLFHIGIVVDDFESTLAELAALFGYRWCEEMRNPTNVVYADGSAGVVPSSFVYSMNAPRLEIIRTLPGTLWVPAAGSGVHHLGYWCDDVEAQSTELQRRGFVAEVTGVRPGGDPFWAYLRHGSGPRVEIVDRQLHPILERYFSTGKVPVAQADREGMV